MPRQASAESSEVAVEWMPLPDKQPNMGMYGDAIKEIERRPGQWARVRVFASKEHAYSAQGGLRKKLDMEKWEVEIRKQEDGTVGMFLRYHRNGKQ